MDISYLAFLRGKGFYCLALLFEHGDVPNHGQSLEQKAIVHQPKIDSDLGGFLNFGVGWQGMLVISCCITVPRICGGFRLDEPKV